MPINKGIQGIKRNNKNKKAYNLKLFDVKIRSINNIIESQ